MLRVLTVFCHPARESFTGARFDSFLEGLADLPGERFDPRLRPAGFARFTKGPAAMPPDVLRAEAPAFVFPGRWWSFPAMLKGWIDRVWCQGWACDFTIRRSRVLLATERAVLPCFAGVPGCCGIDDVAMHVFPGAVGRDMATEPRASALSYRSLPGP